ncbi:MAG: deoxynucleoside kinase [Chitinophagales bacterium]|nr:deoxynucleoside kinase [Chitinophagales bacterium]
MPYNFITIEGNIGAGKTSLATMLANDLNGNLILEQYADNPFLPSFYKNPKQFAFPLELFFMAERYQQLKDLQSSSNLFQSFTVSDYLFAKSILFARVNLEPEEFKLFQRLVKVISFPFREPDLLLYLHLPVELLLKNISKRGRDYEKNISANYLLKIQKAYFDFFKTKPQMRILVVDVSKIDFIKSKKDYDLILPFLDMHLEAGTHFVTPRS